MRIWLDTDIGSDVDDALALAYVLARPELDLVGISTVFGDLSVRGRIAEAVLAADGAEGVPVRPGLGARLSITGSASRSATRAAASSTMHSRCWSSPGCAPTGSCR